MRQSTFDEDENVFVQFVGCCVRSGGDVSGGRRCRRRVNGVISGFRRQSDFIRRRISAGFKSQTKIKCKHPFWIWTKRLFKCTSDRPSIGRSVGRSVGPSGRSAMLSLLGPLFRVGTAWFSIGMHTMTHCITMTFNTKSARFV